MNLRGIESICKELGQYFSLRYDAILTILVLSGSAISALSQVLTKLQPILDAILVLYKFLKLVNSSIPFLETAAPNCMNHREQVQLHCIESSEMGQSLIAKLQNYPKCEELPGFISQ